MCMQYVAIDFETANSSRASACSMAAVTVENGEVVRTAYSLIRPPTLEFDERNIQIHGIRAKDVEHKPNFAAMWERIRTHLDGKIVIAHNAAFDMSVLRSVLQTYNLAEPTFSYACTVKIARRVWPHLASYRLSALADHFAIAFEHHHALHDARTCAQIAWLAQQELGAADFRHMMLKLNLPLTAF